MLLHSAHLTSIRSHLYHSSRLQSSGQLSAMGIHNKSQALIFDTHGNATHTHTHARTHAHTHTHTHTHTGEPENVLKLQEQDVGEPQEGQLLLRFLRVRLPLS